jgi:hypothetical protein
MAAAIPADILSASISCLEAGLSLAIWQYYRTQAM